MINKHLNISFVKNVSLCRWKGSMGRLSFDTLIPQWTLVIKVECDILHSCNSPLATPNEFGWVRRIDMFNQDAETPGFYPSYPN